jgi:hypothetical protein
MVQLSLNTLAKMRVSSRGSVDAMGVFRGWGLHDLIPSVLGSVSLGYNLVTSQPRIGLRA